MMMILLLYFSLSNFMLQISNVIMNCAGEGNDTAHPLSPLMEKQHLSWRESSPVLSCLR